MRFFADEEHRTERPFGRKANSSHFLWTLVRDAFYQSRKAVGIEYYVFDISIILIPFFYSLARPPEEAAWSQFDTKTNREAEQFSVSLMCYHFSQCDIHFNFLLLKAISTKPFWGHFSNYFVTFGKSWHVIRFLTELRKFVEKYKKS